MKNLFVFVTILALGLAGCNCGDNQNKTTASLTNEADTISLYLGYFMGMQTKQQLQFEEIDINAFIAGFNQARLGKDAPGELMEMDRQIGTYLQKQGQKKAEENATKGKAFLEANGKKPGVVTLESGLQYKIEVDGEGPKPAATDVVRVHYRGTLIDGTEFDASAKHGDQPAEFAANRVIPGWTEALQLMSVGSKWTLYIPAELAYGERQAGEHIGPNSTLIFEVELVEIVQPETEE